MFNAKTTQLLESLYEQDQEAIQKFQNNTVSAGDLGSIQKANASAIRLIINEQGFPFLDSASEKAYMAGFLLVQHSGDTELIGKVISIFERATPTQVRKSDVGFLIDKCRVLKSLPQVYGTQYKKAPDGSITFLEIEDREHLDDRRNAIGLAPFTEYEALVRTDSTYVI